MRRLLAATVLAAVVTAAGGVPAYADGWLDECNIWHGEQYCREQYTKAHIPTQGQIREKGRDCRTGWADRRRNCEGQA